MGVKYIKSQKNNKIYSRYFKKKNVDLHEFKKHISHDRSRITRTTQQTL